MQISEQTQSIEQNRKATLRMLSGRHSNALSDLSTIDSTIDRKLYKTNIVDVEAIVVDGDYSLGSNNKKTKSDVNQSMYYNRLLALARQPEISDVLDIMIDELYSFDYGTDQFIRFSERAIDRLDLDKKVKEQIIEGLKSSFDKVYRLHKFNNQTVTKDYDVFKIMKLFLALGKMRFFIEYDNLTNPTTVKAIHYLDPRLYSIERFERIMTGRNMVFYKIVKIGTASADSSAGFGWTSAYNVGASLPAIAMDAQVIDIDWSEMDITASISYLANLERSFNIYRLMERSRIAWAVNNTQFRLIATVPTKGQGYAKSLQTLRAAMAKYSEKVEFDDDAGTVSVNGEPQRAFNKELWLAETTSGKPEFDTIGSDGPDLQDMGPIMYFWQRFLRNTKIPPSMLDREQQNYWSNDAQSISLEYQRFHKYLDRIRRATAPMMIKPTWSDFILKEEFKDFASDNEVKSCVRVEWTTNDVFRKQLQLAELKETAETIDTLGNLKLSDEDKLPILSKRLLLMQYTYLTEEELKLHREAIEKDIADSVEIAKKYSPPDAEVPGF